MDNECITISGFPDTLEAFSDHFRTTGFGVRTSITIDTLYHSSLHTVTRRLVLADVSRRRIHFPDYADIKVPIRSTFTGRIINNKVSSGSLVESVVDMLLIQPVNWNLVVGELVKFRGVSIRMINVGPGVGLTRNVEKMFSCGTLSILDLMATDIRPAREIPWHREPIAIVGMAVNMPGARNTSELWEVLERGVNTIAEVIMLPPLYRLVLTLLPQRFRNIDSKYQIIVIPSMLNPVVR